MQRSLSSIALAVALALAVATVQARVQQARVQQARVQQARVQQVGVQHTGAQAAIPAWNPHTGDAWIDARLADINHYGQRYPDALVDEMTRYFNAPRVLVSALLAQGWAPGDVYYACALAQAGGQPCRSVAEAWTRDHAQGWSTIAQRMGIQAGSPELHRLKRGVVASYAHWARPIQIDESLRADFPDRAVAPATPTRDRGGAPPVHR